MASLRISFPFMTLVFLLFTCSQARDFLVGGKETSWKIPQSSKETLNQWAERMRFKVGDSLLWKYDGNTDSVLHVRKEDYDSCNTSNPIETHREGNTKIKLDRSGPFYFISGAEGHCQKGQKLVVVVLSEKHGPSTQGGSPTAAPIPSISPSAPAPAPATATDGAAHGSNGGFLWVASSFIGLVLLMGMA